MANLGLERAASSSFHAVDLRIFLLEGEQKAYEPRQDAAYLFRDASASTAAAVLHADNPYDQRVTLRLVAGSRNPARVKVEINGRYAFSADLPQSQELPDLRLLGRTQGPLPAEPARYEIRVTFWSDQPDNAFWLLIAEGEAGVGSALQPIPDRAYTRTAEVFRVAIYSLVVFAWALWIVIKDSPGLAGGLVPVLVALFYAALPRIVQTEWMQRLAPAELIRSLFGLARTAGARLTLTGIACAAAGLTFVGLCTALYVVKLKKDFVGDMRDVVLGRRQDYDDIRALMERMPWRREIFLAYEIRSRELKTTTAMREQWRAQVTSLVEAPVFRRLAANPDPDGLIDRAREWLLQKGYRSALAYQDPVLTLAYILPEAEDDRQTARKVQAIDLLRKHRPMDCRATLLRLYIEHDLADMSDQAAGSGPRAWSRTAKDVIHDMERETRRYLGECKGAPAVQEYIAAQDKIAFDRLWHAGRTCGDSDIAAAVAAVSDVLELQMRRATLNERTVWRSPGKLGVYHLHRYLRYEGDERRDPLYGGYFSQYAPLERCEKLKKEIVQAYGRREKELGQDEKWTANTALQTSLHEFVVKELALDWFL